MSLLLSLLLQVGDLVERGLVAVELAHRKGEKLGQMGWQIRRKAALAARRVASRCGPCNCYCLHARGAAT